jgi:hypothetical protein
MEKAQRGKTPQKTAVKMPAGLLEAIPKLRTLDALMVVWAEAVAGGYSADVQDAVTARKKALS